MLWKRHSSCKKQKHQKQIFEYHIYSPIKRTLLAIPLPGNAQNDSIETSYFKHHLHHIIIINSLGKFCDYFFNTMVVEASWASRGVRFQTRQPCAMGRPINSLFSQRYKYKTALNVRFGYKNDHSLSSSIG